MVKQKKSLVKPFDFGCAKLTTHWESLGIRGVPVGFHGSKAPKINEGLRRCTNSIPFSNFLVFLNIKSWKWKTNHCKNSCCAFFCTGFLLNCSSCQAPAVSHLLIIFVLFPLHNLGRFQTARHLEGVKSQGFKA